MPSITKKRVGKYTYLYESVSYRDEMGNPRNKKVRVGKIDPYTGQTVYTDDYIKKMKNQGVLALPEQGDSDIFYQTNSEPNYHFKHVILAKGDVIKAAQNVNNHNLNALYTDNDPDGRKSYIVEKPGEWYLQISVKELWDDGYLTAGKIYDFIMKSALEKIIATDKKTGQMVLSNDELEIPLQDFVDYGLYSTVMNARRAIDSAKEILAMTLFTGEIKAKGKRKKISFSLPLFGIKITDSICTVYFQPRIPWNWFFQYCVPYPPYYFNLTAITSNYLGYLLYIARQHSKEIKEKGYILVSNSSIANYLCLPNPDETKNRARDIIQPFLDANYEISQEDNRKYVQTECIADTVNIKSFLQGKTKITLFGELREYIAGITDKRTKIFETWQAKQEKIQIAAKAKYLESTEKMLSNRCSSDYSTS